MIQQITISDSQVPVIQDIADKEKLTFDETCQLLWDNYATENVRAHEKDMTEKIIRNLTSADKIKIIKDKKL
jgi:hypothetical protein